MIQEAKPKNCVVCGNQFKPFYTTDRFCSTKCAQKHSSSRHNHKLTFKKSIRFREPVSRTRAKAKAKARDNYRCRLNGVDGHICSGRSEAHHILYLSEGGTDNGWNLITLCGLAHATVHSRKSEWQLRLLKMVGGNDWFDKIDFEKLSDNVKKKLEYLREEDDSI